MIRHATGRWTAGEHPKEQFLAVKGHLAPTLSPQINNHLSGGWFIPYKELLATLAKVINRTTVNRSADNGTALRSRQVSRWKPVRSRRRRKEPTSMCPAPRLTESRRSSWCRNWAMSSTDVPSMPCSWRYWIPLLGFLLNLFQEMGHGLLIPNSGGWRQLAFEANYSNTMNKSSHIGSESPVCPGSFSQFHL